MTRHGKNCTASAVYSYSERKKDAKQSGYGTLKERLGADSVKPFDCCTLTLQPCKNPMVTPDGYVFEKEAILQYIVDQKKEQKRQLEAYEKYMKLEDERKQKADMEEDDEKKRKFVALETTPAHVFAYGKDSKKRKNSDSEAGPSAKKDVKEESLSNMSGEKAKVWKSFWVPQLQSTAENSKVEKPSMKVLNPVSGKPLKFKDLMPVIFTPIDEESAKSALIYSMKDRYKCPVTHDVLTNTTRCAYIKPSKRVVSWNCVENIIKKDMIDPLTNKPLTADDIIELQRGGTGFASTNQIEAKVARPQMELA